MAGPHSGALPSDQTSRFIQFGSWIEGCYGDENRAAHTHANVTAVPGAAAHASTLVLKLPKQRQQLASAKPISRLCCFGWSYKSVDRKRVKASPAALTLDNFALTKGLQCPLASPHPRRIGICALNR